MVDVEASLAQFNRSQFVPVSLTDDWQRITSLTKLLTADTSPVVLPTLILNQATNYRFFRRGRGTHLLLRVGYDAGANITTNPILQVFGGGTDLTKQLEQLENASGSVDLTFTASASDVVTVDTLYKMTRCIKLDHWVDMQSCDFGQIAVKTAIAGTSLTNGFVEAKLA